MPNTRNFYNLILLIWLLVPSLENWIACDIFISTAYSCIATVLQYTKNAFVAVFIWFLEVFYTLKESLK